MRLNTKEMKYLLALNHEKTIAGAAGKTGKNPSSLRRCVNRIENELGISLFYRVCGEMVPTLEGKLYLDMAEEIVRMEEELYS